MKIFEQTIFSVSLLISQTLKTFNRSLPSGYSKRIGECKDELMVVIGQQTDESVYQSDGLWEEAVGMSVFCTAYQRRDGGTGCV